MKQAVPRLQAGDTFEYRVRAVNGSTESENKIHEDSVARQYGFRGGLVPGVTDYAYMTRPALDAFGPEWLERGDERPLREALYDGEMVIARATVADAGTLTLEALNESGEVCAPGAATLPATTGPLPRVDDFPWRALPSPADRAPADEASLAVGTVLGSIDTEFSVEAAARLAIEVPDDHAVYEGPDAVAHPGYLIRFANGAAPDRPHGALDSRRVRDAAPRPRPLREQLSTRARVVELFERKGHHFVVLDVATFANGDRPSEGPPYRHLPAPLTGVATSSTYGV
jgi:hypothetical protein